MYTYFYKIIGIAILLLLGSGALGARASGGQTPLGYPSGDDWEPAIAADHFGHVYVLWPHYGGVPGCDQCPSPTALLQISSDHGQTWTEPRVVTPDYLGTYQVDTQIVVGPVDGQTVYAAWLQNNKSDTIVLKSTDFGQTWSKPVIADHTDAGTDKPILLVRGLDLYIAYDHSPKMWVAASHNGGQTFSQSFIRFTADFGVPLAGGGAIDSKGNVYFAWGGYKADGQGPVNLYLTKSPDHGRTWASRLIFTSSSPPDCSEFSCGYAFLGAQMVMTADANDALYLLWNAGANRVPKEAERIYFSRSTDYGATWSAPQDVSLAGQGVSHAFPAIASSGQAGDVRIAWMDARNNGRWNVIYRSSSDGGATWSPETQLSSYVEGYSYINADGYQFPFGDYFEMDVDETTTTHVVWGEGANYVGPGNIWYNRVGP